MQKDFFLTKGAENRQGRIYSPKLHRRDESREMKKFECFWPFLMTSKIINSFILKRLLKFQHQGINNLSAYKY